MPIDPIIGSAAIQAGSGLLGMVAGQGQTNAQYGQQKDLMALQLKNQKELNNQGAELSYQNWLRTNYSAQREQMEKAGLNVGMMYGMGGAGGTLTGGSGGSAASGQAPAPNNQMAMLLGDLAANIQLKKAQAENLSEETKAKKMDNETKEMFGQDADKYEAENRGREALQKGQYLYNNLAITIGSNLMNIPYVKNLENEIVIKDLERRLQEETYADRKEQVAQNLAKTKMEIELGKSQTKLTDKQKEKVWHDIWQGWVNAGFNGLGKIIDGVFKGGLLKNIDSKKIK